MRVIIKPTVLATRDGGRSSEQAAFQQAATSLAYMDDSDLHDDFRRFVNRTADCMTLQHLRELREVYVYLQAHHQKELAEWNDMSDLPEEGAWPIPNPADFADWRRDILKLHIGRCVDAIDLANRMISHLVTLQEQCSLLEHTHAELELARTGGAS